MDQNEYVVVQYRKRRYWQSYNDHRGAFGARVGWIERHVASNYPVGTRLHVVTTIIAEPQRSA